MILFCDFYEILYLIMISCFELGFGFDGFYGWFSVIMFFESVFWYFFVFSFYLDDVIGWVLFVWIFRV